MAEHILLKANDTVDWAYPYTGKGTVEQEFGPGPFFVNKVMPGSWNCGCGEDHTDRAKCANVLQSHPQILMLSVYWRCMCDREHGNLDGCSTAQRSAKKQVGWNRHDFDGVTALSFKKV